MICIFLSFCEEILGDINIRKTFIDIEENHLLWVLLLLHKEEMSTQTLK